MQLEMLHELRAYQLPSPSRDEEEEEDEEDEEDGEMDESGDVQDVDTEPIPGPTDPLQGELVVSHKNCAT